MSSEQPVIAWYKKKWVIALVVIGAIWALSSASGPSLGWQEFALVFFFVAPAVLFFGLLYVVIRLATRPRR